MRTPFSELIPEPHYEASKMQPPTAGTNAILAEIMEAANDPANIPFGAGNASPELFPNARLNLILRRVIHRQPQHSARYEISARSRTAPASGSRGVLRSWDADSPRGKSR